MPVILQKMFDADKLNFKVTQSTFPGMELKGHLTDIITSRTENGIQVRKKTNGDTTETEKVLSSKKWDYVVLQEGTIKLLIPEAKTLLTIPAIQEIKNRVKDSKTQFILFKTWPSLDTFPKQYCYPSIIIDKSIKKEECCSPTIKSLDEEIRLINSNYDTVATTTGLTSLPITNCFADVLKNHPNINLYEDEIHPSKLGAYLNACVFYKCFTKRKAITIKYYADIDEKTALIIQNVVDKNYP